MHTGDIKHVIARDRAAAFLTLHLARNGVGYAFISTYTLNILDRHWDKGDLHLLYECTWALINQVVKNIVEHDTRFKIISNRFVFDDAEGEETARVVIDFMPMYCFGLPDQPKTVDKKVNGILVPILHPWEVLVVKVKHTPSCAYNVLRRKPNARAVFMTNLTDIVEILEWPGRRGALVCKQKIARLCKKL
jgi:hypothetical protein